jgi:hypothetical protein
MTAGGLQIVPLVGHGSQSPLGDTPKRQRLVFGPTLNSEA